MAWRTFPYWLFAILLLTAVQAIWRSDVLIQRPYGSAALGTFSQASGLAFGESFSAAAPAPVAARASVVPHLLAGLMRALPAGTPLVLSFRLICLAMASLVVVGLVAHLYPTCGWASALLAGGALLTTPLFAVQAELMTETIFMVAAVVWGALAFRHGRFFLAGILAMLAFWAHWIAICYLAAACIVLGYRAIARSNHRSWLGLAMHAIALIVLVAVIVTQADPDRTGGGWTVLPEDGLSSLEEVVRWSPDVLIVAGVALLAMVIFARPSSPFIRSATESSPLGLCWWTILILTAVSASLGSIPSQWTLAVPLVLLSVTWSLHRVSWVRPVAQGFLYLLIAINLINSTGRLFPPISAGPDYRTSSLRERSREYLATDHAYHVDAVLSVLRRCRERRIVAPPPMAHFLSLPALGYVIEPFEGYVLGPDRVGNWPTVDQLREDPYHPIALVHLRHRGTENLSPPLPTPLPADEPVYPRRPEIFEQPAFQASPLYVFIPRETPSDPPEEAKRRYVRRLWPEELLYSRVRELIALGNLRDAEPLLRELLQSAPKQHQARIELASLLEGQDRLEEALAEYRLIPASSNEYWRASSQIAQILTAQEKFDEADPFHAESLRACQKRSNYQPPEGAQILVRWATNDIGRRSYSNAREKLRQAIRILPSYWMSHRELGYVLFNEKRSPDAVASLERAIELNANDPVTYRYLGATWAAMEQWDKGADAFRKGLLLNPADAECLDGLITVLLKMGRYDEVISEVEDAIAARPDEALHVPFLLGLAEALQSRGDWERAIATIRRAVDQAPDSKDARNQLAWALATAPDERWRDGAEGAEVARPLEADIENSIYLDTLAAVRAELGQWEQAIDFEEKALAIARKEGRADRVADFEKRLELYRQQKPYRSPTGQATP